MLPPSIRCLYLLALLACAVHRPWERALAGTETLLIEPGRSVGNVRLGMRPRAVERRLGPPASVGPFEADTYWWNWQDLGFSIRFTRERVDAIILYSGALGGYNVGDFKKTFPGRTPGGITLDSSPRDVIQILGAPDKRGEDWDAPLPRYWFDYKEGIRFEFRMVDDRLINIIVHSEF